MSQGAAHEGRTGAYYTIGLASPEGAEAVEPPHSTRQSLRSGTAQPAMTRLFCDGPTLLRAVAAAVANLEQHVEEVDALNVFPVPDGDTGSNMLATMRAALAQAERLSMTEQSLRNVAAALRQGALRGARGNSGVILSQIIRGMTDGADGRRRATGLDLAQGLRRGSDVAYDSVLTPVEGTILTVIRDAATAAEVAAGHQPHVESVLAVTIEAAARSVQRTPSLLPLLEEAGVVDSGGQGLFRLLEGTLHVAGPAREGATPKPPPRRVAPPLSQAPWMAASAGAHEAGAHEAGARVTRARPTRSDEGDGHSQHGYETEFVVSAGEGRLDIETIRSELQGAGESIIVAGDDHMARVHVHGMRPDLALGIGVRWGRLGSVSVKDLDAQVEARTLGARTAGPADGAPRAGIAMLAVAPAAGLAATLEGLGARVIRPAHGARPSVGEIAAGILAAGAAEVIVLPNDRDAHLAAGQAASLTPLVTVAVVPTRNAAEGIAAALAFDGDADLAHNTDVMAAEAGALRSFSVSQAARDSLIDGTTVHAGEVIALDAGRTLLTAAETVEAATLQALSRLGDFELVTCYRGAALEAARADRLAQAIRARFGAVEVEVVTGGQPHDHLLVAVE